IMPESKGLLLRSSEEFRVLRIVQMPGGLSYEGIPSSLEGTGAATMPLLMDVAEIPGESHVGCYDPQTGRIEALTESALGFSLSLDEEKTPVNGDLLAGSLAMHLEERQLALLAEDLLLDGQGITGRAERARVIVEACLAQSRLGDLARAISRISIGGA
nr:hypothetical protein [Anaerolinea sp.]